MEAAVSGLMPETVAEEEAVLEEETLLEEESVVLVKAIGVEGELIVVVDL